MKGFHPRCNVCSGCYQSNTQEMNEMIVENWWDEICGRGKWEKPRENLPILRFVNHEPHMEGHSRELGTPEVGGERLTACSTEPPTPIS